MTDLQRLLERLLHVTFSAFRSPMALLVMALACSGCASKSGAWSKQLIAGREVTGVARNTYTNRLWAYAQDYAEGDLADVEFFYNPKRIDGIDYTLMGMIARVRLPKGLEGWEQQAKHFGLSITGFAGVLRRGWVDKKEQPQFYANLGTDRPWPQYQLLYRTSAPHVFAVIEKGRLTHLAREVRPFNPIPGPVDKYGSSWFSEEIPNSVEVVSFAQIKKRRQDELQKTLPKYDTDQYDAYMISQILPQGVTPDLRAYLDVEETSARDWLARHNALIDRLKNNETLPAATLVAIADEYNRARPEAKRIDPKVESPHYVAPLFRKHFDVAIARAKQDGRIATAAGLALQLFRVEQLDRMVYPFEAVGFFAALDAPDDLLGRARALAVRAFLESALLLKPAPGLESIAARIVPDLPPLLTERLAIKPVFGNQLMAAADRLGIARMPLIELAPGGTLKPHQYLKDYDQSTTISQTTTDSDLRRWERAYQEALDQLKTADEWHRARIADIKRPKSDFKSLQGAEPAVSDTTWALAQDKAMKDEQLSYQTGTAAVRDRIADLEARRPEVGKTTERKSDVTVRYRCLVWEGELTRRLRVDPEGRPADITATIKVGGGQFGGDCVPSTSTSDLPIETFYNRTEQRILDTAGFDAFDTLRLALITEMDKRRGPAGELPSSVRGDAPELTLEKAFRAAYVGRGPWPTPSLK